MEVPSSKNMERTTVRILALSDTHNTSLPIPKAGLSSVDIILHAGDLTNNGTRGELEKQFNWLRKLSGCSCPTCDPLSNTHQKDQCSEQQFGKSKTESSIPVLFTAGNHDLGLHASFDSSLDGGTDSVCHSKEPLEWTANCHVTYLEYESSAISLFTKRDGQNAAFSIYGSPLSPLLTESGESQFSAFTYASSQLSASHISTEGASSLFASIPDATTILVSHAPPYGVLDIDRHGKHTGCPLLWKHIQRIKPRLVVCGHRHEGRGCVKLRWDNTHKGVKEAWRWKDPGQGGKLSVVSEKAELWERLEWDSEHGILDSQFNGSLDSTLSLQKPGSMFVKYASPAEDYASSGEVIEQEVQQAESQNVQERITLIVNAAIMASSYQKSAAKRFNKPIFVDLVLPCANDAQRGKAEVLGGS
jgi:Icc-related predicted phosphoesterase